MISIRNLTFRYAGSPEPALRDITLDIEAGEFVVITGKSGCGKSTLALAIAGVLFEQHKGENRGEILVDDSSVLHTPVFQTAHIVGLVQQNPEAQFCTLTVQDEVAFGLENRCVAREKILPRVHAALEATGASHLIQRNLASLSGGEQQRVAIASVIATDPAILIFDEPTSNLDPQATTEIFNVIRELRSRNKLTVLVIEHKLQFLLPFHPRTITLANGRIEKDISVTYPAPGELAAPRPAKKVSAASSPAVCVRNLSIQLGEHPALKNINAEVQRGEFISIMGENGSGKTTFLQSLLGLIPANNGSVSVFGEKLGRAPVSRLARRIGFIFQNPDHQLFASSVWEEATLAPINFGILSEDLRKRARELLTDCDLLGREADHPYRLSYGQKRRLNLISILTYKPDLLLVDEILIGQDHENAHFLLGLLRRCADDGGSVLLVNHHPGLSAPYADRVLFFHAGELVIDADAPRAYQQLRQQGRDAFTPDGLFSSAKTPGEPE